jgi:hypothetical protein
MQLVENNGQDGAPLVVEVRVVKYWFFYTTFFRMIAGGLLGAVTSFAVSIFWIWRHTHNEFPIQQITSILTTTFSSGN